MNKSITVLLVLASLSSYAKTTLRIPLFAEKNDKIIPMSEVNSKYKKNFPTELVITDEKGSADAARKLYWDIFGKFESIKDPIELANDIPGSNKLGNLRTCYTGSAEVAVDLAASMSDSIYSDQLGFWGWKYRSDIHVDADDSETKKDMLKALNEQSSLWKNWRGLDDSILIVSHQSDDGDDMNEGIIVKCK